jgi:phage tail-like protein
MDVHKGVMQNATRNVTISMYDSTRKTVVSKWIFKKAYPIRYGGPTLRSSESAVAIEELELAHSGFEVE